MTEEGFKSTDNMTFKEIWGAFVVLYSYVIVHIYRTQNSNMKTTGSKLGRITLKLSSLFGVGENIGEV